MKRNTRLHDAALAGLAAISLALPALAQEAGMGRPPTIQQYSPNVDQNFPNRVLWGLTHIHTSLSADAGLMGITLGPDQLFRSAMGQEVVTTTGLKFKLERPLDWIAITDHAEYLGLSDQLASGNRELLANPTGKKWYDLYKGTPQQRYQGAMGVFQSIVAGKDLINNTKLKASAWATAYEAAERYNQPGIFTTLHGFEWTSVPGGNNLHRTLIFRDNVDRVKQTIPFSAFDSVDCADLWKYMDAYEKQTGGQVLAIPHNGNLSNGRMYTAETYEGKPMDLAYAAARIGHEPLVEVTQIKGRGETHPYLSPSDEFAGSELWDVGNASEPIVPKEKSMLVPRSSLGWSCKRSLESIPTSSAWWAPAMPILAWLILGRITSSASLFSTRPHRSVGRLYYFTTRMALLPLSIGGINLRAWAAFGQERTPARQSGTRSSARKSMPPRVSDRSYVSSGVGTSCRRTRTAPTSRNRATPVACPWAAI